MFPNLSTLKFEAREGETLKNSHVDGKLKRLIDLGLLYFVLLGRPRTLLLQLSLGPHYLPSWREYNKNPQHLLQSPLEKHADEMIW